MNIKPIRTKADYKEALKRVDQIFDAEVGTPEGDELDILATLVEKYEDEHYPIESPDPIDAIKFRLDQMGLKQSSLVGVIGTRARVSEILNGKRPLTLPMIRNLHSKLKIPLESLIGQNKGVHG